MLIKLSDKKHYFCCFLSKVAIGRYFMEKFSDILNDLIIDKGLSLRKLAEESKVSANQYSRYLKGAIPTVHVAIKLANYFKRSLDYLFGLNDDNKDYIPCNNYDLSKFVERYENLLELNKISHWKFAKHYGLSESALRHWKYGDTPKIESLVIIAINLSTSIEYLVGRTDNM